MNRTDWAYTIVAIFALLVAVVGLFNDRPTGGALLLLLMVAAGVRLKKKKAMKNRP